MKESLKIHLQNLDLQYLKGDRTLYTDLLNQITVEYYNIQNTSEIKSDYYQKQNVVIQILLLFCAELNEGYTVPISIEKYQKYYSPEIFEIIQGTLVEVIYKVIPNGFASIKTKELAQFEFELRSRQKTIRRELIIVKNTFKSDTVYSEKDQVIATRIKTLYKSTPHLYENGLFRMLEKAEQGLLYDKVFTIVEDLFFKKEIYKHRQTGEMVVAEAQSDSAVGSIRINAVETANTLVEEVITPQVTETPQTKAVEPTQSKTVAPEKINTVELNLRGNFIKISQEIDFIDQKYLNYINTNSVRDFNLALNYSLAIKLELNSNKVNKLAENTASRYDFYTEKSELIDYLIAEFETIQNLKFKQIKKTTLYEDLFGFTSLLFNKYLAIDRFGYIEIDQNNRQNILEYFESTKNSIASYLDLVKSGQLDKDVKQDKTPILSEINNSVVHSDLDCQNTKEESFDNIHRVEAVQNKEQLSPAAQESLEAKTQNICARELVQLENICDNPYLAKYIDKKRLLEDKLLVEEILNFYMQGVTAEQISEVIFERYQKVVKIAKVVDILVWLLKDKSVFENGVFRLRNQQDQIDENNSSDEVTIKKEDVLTLIKEAKIHSNHPKVTIFVDNFILGLNKI